MRKILESLNITSDLDGGTGQVKSPYIFSNEEENDFFVKWENKAKKLNQILESTYNDFKNDSTRSSRQKINESVVEIHKKLREVERMITHASKLKTETGANQNIFWKRTLGNFQKIDERLLKLSNKIREMNK